MADSAPNDADEYRATHGGSIDGFSGGDKGGYVKPATTYVDPRLSDKSAGAGPAGPQRKEFGDGLQGDADYSKALRRYRSTVAKGQTMAMSKDTGGSSTTP